MISKGENLIEEIAYDICNNAYFNQLNKKIIQLYTTSIFNESYELLEEKESNDIFRFIDLLSLSSDDINRSKAYSVLSLLYPLYSDNELYKKYMYSLISKLGLFALENTLINTSDIILPIDRNTEKEIKKENQKVPNSKYYFTDVQFKLFNQLKAKTDFSFSGPTSMGKSFLIKQYIRHIVTELKNIVILVPTRALINQTLIDIRMELSDLENNYKLFTNSNLSEVEIDNATSYILIYTPERLMSFLSQKNDIVLDIAFIDEAHKLSADDDRSITAYSAVENLIYSNSFIQLYFSSPNISNPELYLKQFKRNIENSISIKESPVGQNLYFADFNNNELSYIIDSEFIKLNNDMSQFRHSFDFINNLGRNEVSNLIYCSSPDKAITVAENLYSMIDNKIDDIEIDSATKKISEYVHSKYYLVKWLKKGVGYHFGQMPQNVKNIVEDLYRKNKIKYLITTATLLEGVNMPTKNIFIFKDDKFNYKNDGLHDFQDTSAKVNFWNLVGRAGRYTQELSGNIFCIESERVTNRKWKKEIFDKRDINIEFTVSNKLTTKSEDIKNSFKEGTNKNEKQYSNIANLICIDILKKSDSYISSLLTQLESDSQDEIIKLATEKANKVKDMPIEILSSNYTIDLEIQNNIYNDTINNMPQTFKFVPPKYPSCLAFLTQFSKMYDWENQEEKLLGKYYDENNTNNKLKFLAFLMNRWMNGATIKELINGSINRMKKINDDYNKELDEGKEPEFNQAILFRRGIPTDEIFDADNESHINIEIDNILTIIEKELRFRLEKYFNHFYQIADTVRDSKHDIGQNWATYLEYGTRSLYEIELQNFGFSRYAANKLVKGYFDYLQFNEDKKFIQVKKEIYGILDKDSIEYDELIKVIN